MLRRAGEPEQAAGCFRRAVELHGDAATRVDQADSLGNLGDVLAELGRTDEARAAWSDALAIFADVHHDGAAAMRSRLAAGVLP